MDGAGAPQYSTAPHCSTAIAPPRHRHRAAPCHRAAAQSRRSTVASQHSRAAAQSHRTEPSRPHRRDRIAAAAGTYRPLYDPASAAPISDASISGAPRSGGPKSKPAPASGRNPPEQSAGNRGGNPSIPQQTPSVGPIGMMPSPGATQLSPPVHRMPQPQWVSVLPTHAPLQHDSPSIPVMPLGSVHARPAPGQVH